MVVDRLLRKLCWFSSVGISFKEKDERSMAGRHSQQDYKYESESWELFSKVSKVAPIEALITATPKGKEMN